MGERVLIIAEAGVNHNGSLELAKQLIDVAADAGVDYVKFQSFKTELLVSKSAKKADYQIQNTNNNTETQFNMLKKLELSENDHEEILAYCLKKNISFFSTAFDLESLQYLSKIGLNIVKIPSGEITNLPYLKLAATLFENVIISTGMSTLNEIESAINVFLKHGTQKENITVLHCNTDYPTKMTDVNLKAMQTIQEKFNVQIGYSDHTLGIEVPIAAVALGAVVIEKHFTLDRTMDGPDHPASLEPLELKQMVQSIRNIEQALGNGIKTPSQSEMKNIVIARRSIHLGKDLEANHSLKEEDLIMKRPGDGISPMKLDEIIHRKLKKDLPLDHKLSLEDLV